MTSNTSVTLEETYNVVPRWSIVRIYILQNQAELFLGCLFATYTLVIIWCLIVQQEYLWSHSESQKLEVYVAFLCVVARWSRRIVSPACILNCNRVPWYWFSETGWSYFSSVVLSLWQCRAILFRPQNTNWSELQLIQPYSATSSFIGWQISGCLCIITFRNPSALTASLWWPMSACILINSDVFCNAVIMIGRWCKKKTGRQ